MSFKMIRFVERRIVRRLIKDGLEAGYKIAVNNGEEEFGPFSNAKEIIDQMFSVDDEKLMFYKMGDYPVGWVYFVYGNDGWDVINDYTTNLEHIMAGANKESDRWED